MANMVNVNFKLDEDVKKRMEYVCSEMGLSLSAAFTIYAKKVAREKRIPFELCLYEPNEDTYRAIERAEKGQDIYGPFNSVEEMMESLDA